MEQLKGYKTIAFFVLVLVIAVDNLIGFADFKLSAEQQELFNVLVPLIGLGLRYITTSPVFKG